MRVTVLLLYFLLGLAAGRVFVRQADSEEDNVVFNTTSDGDDDIELDKSDPEQAGNWKPLTKDPHFFVLRVDEEKCGWKHDWPWPGPQWSPPGSSQGNPPGNPGCGGPGKPPCPRQVDATDSAPPYPYGPPDPEDLQKPWKPCFADYGVRLDKQIAIATPYDSWWDPPLPTFFVDDDTQMYTISKRPLQLYVDGDSGALQYDEVGWIPPNSISLGFFHTGDNPLGAVDPSPSLLSWPSTPGIAFDGYWLLCPIGSTGQYQIFVDDQNFEPQGVQKEDCWREHLAAINTGPWKSAYYNNGHDEDQRG